MPIKQDAAEEWVEQLRRLGPTHWKQLAWETQDDWGTLALFVLVQDRDAVVPAFDVIKAHVLRAQLTEHCDVTVSFDQFIEGSISNWLYLMENEIVGAPPNAESLSAVDFEIGWEDSVYCRA